MRIYTKKGDDGSTGLLYGGRVPKNDPRTDVYGTLDEVVSCLGLAHSAGLVPRVESIVIRVQRELFAVGAQLATAPANQEKLQDGISKVSAEMTEALEADIDALLGVHPLPQEFILPGETSGSAALDLARSIVRRAERKAVAMDRSGELPDPEILRYLNRASDLIFTLARHEEAERGRRAAPSRPR
jgi:cob(I)alamin adenosyltransferase